MNARVDPADQLEHHAVADHHRAVGLLGAEVAHCTFIVQPKGRQQAGALETQLASATATGQAQAILAAVQHRADKRFEHEGIGNQAYLMGTAHPRQGQLLRQRCVDLIFGQQAKR
ncbi:hypothetical protein D3C76_1260390 [compost metagenome]